jgi:predicted Rossmann-fold nucleotide-binding protein
MGQLAKATLEVGGEVIGVITKKLMGVKVALTELPRLYMIGAMRKRKARMAEIIALEHRNMIIIDETPESLLRKFQTYQAPKNNKAE